MNRYVVDECNVSMQVDTLLMSPWKETQVLQKPDKVKNKKINFFYR